MAAAAVGDTVQPEVLHVTVNISPENHASLIINLINEIQVRQLENDEHDLTLFFLWFSQAVLDALQRLTPELPIVNADLSTAHIYLNLAVITKRTRSEANKTRIVDVINVKGVDFLAALQRYRVGPQVIVSDD